MPGNFIFLQLPYYFSVRLEDGEVPWQGRLEVSYDGDFGYVCNNDFGDDEAEVVCGMLGFEGGRIATEEEGEMFYIGDEDELDADKHLDEVDCEGDEDNIALCSHDGWRKTDCSLDEIVGVICGT